MKIALVQMNSTGDPQANLDKVADHTAAAAVEGAQLVVFPEATQIAFGHDLARAAADDKGGWIQSITEIARKNETVIAVGVFRPGDNGTVTNSLVVRGIDDGREVSADYDKVHLYDAFGHRESDSVTAGESVRTFRLGDLTFGLAICYDVRFPALFTAQARAGADAIILATSWGAGPGKVEQWKLLGPARALDSTAYVLACDQADPAVTEAPAKEGNPTGIGHSYVAAPNGELLAEAGRGEEIIFADIDPDRITDIRASLPVLNNSRLEKDIRVESI
ncbi:carbon-nitrogen hydrolase family protein [Brevibacterium sediminis]|uniref:Apolipoprotein acyltransferase n=1 Tax=Brevibacterium sediminis TaxID=1857024 RepID=A0ABQ1M262_9MICO|nr:carbon-nitrogen hydrolase family protein [Brevibacterium sediminis]GGC31933.1 apolipoprotein acyltransferase [Brevibacterium sediminis]